jgi:hypothetical protein
MPGQRDSEPDVIDGKPVDDDSPWIEGSTTSFRPSPTRSRARGWVREHPRAFVLALVCGCALAGVLALVLASAGAPAPAHAHPASHGPGIGGVLVVLVLVAAIAVAYGVSLRINPWRKCRWCKGRGKHDDRLFKWAHGLCSHCGGAGRWPRLGVRLFRNDEYLKMRAKLNR